MDSSQFSVMPVGGIRRYDARPVGGHSRTLLSPFELLLLTPPPETIDKICSHWTPDVLFKIRQLSTSAFYAMEAYFFRQMNIYQHLRRWAPNVQEFFRQLTLSDGLISGSEALSFLDRRQFLGEDLDIYVPLHGLLSMGRFLKSCGYVYQAPAKSHLLFDAAAMMLTSRHVLNGKVPHASSAGPPSRKHHKQRKPQQKTDYLAPTFDFVRPIPHGLPYTYGTHVQLIAVHGDPMEFIINNFHSTGVMNVLTTTHAISLFPHTTFNLKQTCACRDLSKYPDWAAPWMSKYAKRGFKILKATNTIPHRAELHTWKRKVGDNMTWIFPYKRHGEYPYRLNATPPTLDAYTRYSFEVLDVSFGVVPTGAAVHVGPRSIYSSAAWVVNPDHPRLSYTYFSAEVAIAFSDYYHGVSDDDPADSEASTGETGDTEEAD